MNDILIKILLTAITIISGIAVYLFRKNNKNLETKIAEAIDESKKAVTESQKTQVLISQLNDHSHRIRRLEERDISKHDLLMEIKMNLRFFMESQKVHYKDLNNNN